MSRTPIPAILSLLLLAGCSGAEGAGSNDIDALPQLRATEERRIGSVDDPETGFSRLYRIDIDRDGNVYALEGLDNEIRVYDDAGRVIRRIGGRGAGPAEFENAPAFGVVGDTLWAYDNDNGRITLFDLAGTVIGSGRTTGLGVPLHNGYGYVLPERMRADGRFIGWPMRISYSRDTTTSVAENDHVTMPRVLFDVTGAIVDTLSNMSAPPWMVPPPGYDREMGWVSHGGRRHAVPSPPPELPEWLPGEEGHFVVDVPYIRSPGSFTVTHFDLAGDTVWHRALTYTPEPYTDEDLDAVARLKTVWMPGESREQTDETLVNVVRAELDFPAFRKPIDDTWVANDGAVWLARPPSDSSRTWVVLDRDGAVRGAVQLPARARPLWSRGAIMWASVPDEMDVPWLVSYRVEA